MDKPKQDIWRHIYQNLLIQQSENGYGESQSKPVPGNWISMLLYPTEVTPFLKMELFKRNLAVQCFLDDYADRAKGSHQPWVYFWQDCSDMHIDEDRIEQIENII